MGMPLATQESTAIATLWRKQRSLTLGLHTGSTEDYLGAPAHQPPERDWQQFWC